MPSKVKGIHVNWNIKYDFVLVFHKNIAGTVSEMLAQIDHKCPNWTFKMTFRVTSDLSYFSFHTKDNTHDAIT